ncbi:MAG: DUF4861 domain-containing protein [Bacteroidales bacterium]|nr:DUF4861 domain-containing protein [Bacteroidales bacterium]
MKKWIFLLVGVLIFISGCKPLGTWIRFTNPLDIGRKDEKIVLTADQLAQWREIPSGLLPMLIEKDADLVPTQVDDLDGDGEWDELVALIELGPKEKKVVQMIFVEASIYPKFDDRTNVRLGTFEKGYPELTSAERLEGVSYHNHSITGDAFQMEGPAWENDFVGFRNYLDQRNGMDIFGKITPEMALDSVGLKDKERYHSPDHWGMDILKVGTSLGAGSIAYHYKDSIFRVGDNGKGTYELVVDGKLRSVIRFRFNPWHMDDQLLDVTQYIEIQGGTRYYESTVSYSGTDETVDLVTGIVNMKSEQLHVEELNGQYTALYTHDVQSEDTTILGMALLLPSDRLLEYGPTKDSGEGITQTYFARLKAEPDEPVKYRFYSFWERENQKWKDPSEIIRLMKEDAERMANPVTVTLRSNKLPD